jgi:hypothetical protein
MADAIVLRRPATSSMHSAAKGASGCTDTAKLSDVLNKLDEASLSKLLRDQG